MRTLLVAVTLFGSVAHAHARTLSAADRRVLAGTLIFVGGLASAAGTVVALVWNAQFWSQFGCELGNGIPALFGGMPGSENCGSVDGALIPTGAALVGVGQAAVITGSVLLRF